MAMRDLVAGAGCADDSSGVNPLAALLHSVQDDGDKARMHGELQHPPDAVHEDVFREQGHEDEALFREHEALYGQPPLEEMVEGFLHGQPPPGAEAFEEIYSQVGHGGPIDEAAFEEAYGAPPVGPQEVVPLADSLRNFVDACRSGRLLEPFQLPGVEQDMLDPADKARIRNRAAIMGRHFVQQDDEAFVEEQLNRLFGSCQIDPTEQFDEVYEEIQRTPGPGPQGLADQWAREMDGDLDEYEDAYQAAFRDDFADNFLQQLQHSAEAVNNPAQEGLQSFVEQMKNSDDPKWQQSKFLDFLTKMSQGEISFGENDILEHGNREYEFDYPNLNRYVQSEQPFEEGVQLFQQGMLPESIEALEAEVQRHPDNSEAWKQLGLAHAEHDQDDKAIAALGQAISVDPENLDVLLAMSVSHANLLNHTRAVDVLRDWITRHVLYKGITPPTVDHEGFELNPHEQVVQMFETAAELNPEDADLFMALGVLMNLSADYDKAVNAFRRALDLRSDDYTLWNKLGATLANSNRSAEAVEAYKRCLEIKPTYVRGWTNMGISHTDTGNYHTAAEYYLGALAANPNAEHVWGYLTTLFSLMERPDLINLASNQDLDAFRGEFDF